MEYDKEKNIVTIKHGDITHKIEGDNIQQLKAAFQVHIYQGARYGSEERQTLRDEFDRLVGI